MNVKYFSLPILTLIARQNISDHSLFFIFALHYGFIIYSVPVSSSFPKGKVLPHRRYHGAPYPAVLLSFFGLVVSSATLLLVFMV